MVIDTFFIAGGSTSLAKESGLPVAAVLMGGADFVLILRGEVIWPQPFSRFLTQDGYIQHAHLNPDAQSTSAESLPIPQRWPTGW